MHPSAHAGREPAKPAVIMAATGETIDYAALETRSNQSAQLLRELGFVRGAIVATLFDNGPEVFVLGLAVQRSGLYLTSISNKLSVQDIAYILKDCGASVLLASDRHADAAAEAATIVGGVRVFAWSRDIGASRAWSALAATQPGVPIADQSPGTDLLYSSGTTGRPKGIKFALPDGGIDHVTPLMAMGAQLYGMGADTIYLSTSPLYHAAPLRWAMTIHRLGGTVIVMDRFDAATALALIERYHVSHATFVPTHFIRLLKLPADLRTGFSTKSLRRVVHAAAPCPVPIKRAMIDWLGPIVDEYYAGTEQCGITAISASEWLEHPGSVGRAVLGTLRITDDAGNELPVGEEGNVCFADGPAFQYLNDPDKTAQAYDRNGWATLGDIGRIDEDGFLYLTDRKSFMIISGGVNIYPQEIENLLITHDAVADVAVIGIPDEEMGESVLAVVQPAAGVAAGEELADELRRFARTMLGGVKTPRQFVFRAELPREPTGKLMKRALVDEFRARAPFRPARSPAAMP